ncbi:hypothetical protein [Enterobacter kobei]|uniref:hypothetical protein n=1 Tax=Enterobacter kobei TaxID=208224 RepID=UPI00190FFC73|nr:hypothetical protein [Enterobacter kobei]
MKKIIIGVVLSLSAISTVNAEQLTDQEMKDAQEFAQALIQRDYQCNKVIKLIPANAFHEEINVWCDEYLHYEITKPGGRWKVKAD